MKKIFLIILLSSMINRSFSQTDYKTYPVYYEKDLGLTYTKDFSIFKIWAPGAEKGELLFYKEGDSGDVYKVNKLEKGIRGTWHSQVPGDLKGMFYTFRVSIDGKWSNEVPDPYAKAVGVNGKRAMVVDLDETNPENWEKDKSPSFSKTNAVTDAVIYELHVRDASIDESSGIGHKGKFFGLAEENTTSADGLSTGLSHLKELGVTHIHLLPFFDYNSVDETKLDKPQYNWGYDPLNYNVPEGSYSTNPYDGVTRIKELKQMITAFHKNGLRVVMDVVYNHVANAKTSNFEQFVPGYYFRHKKDGSFSDATACGNETASEMPMMQKFMLESVLYWVKEYHIDGFRFDLMGVHDIATMNLIAAELRKIKPDILLYGEGWTAGASPLPDNLRALKANASKLNHIAVFSDDIRDGIKGSVFDIKDKGFVSGKPGMEESVKFGVAASCNHPQVNMKKVNYSKKAYAKEPWNTITYCECHDNNALWDKLYLSCPEASRMETVKMQKLALTIVLTSQGIPFLHAGTEFLRDKKEVENSFNAGDSVNAIDWRMKKENKQVFEYVKELIQLRKDHPAFRMTSSQQVRQNIHFDNKAEDGTIVFTINGSAAKDKWKRILVAYNGNREPKIIKLSPGNWKNAYDAGGKIISGSLELSGISALIIYQD